jgi:PKD repeat protein
VRHTLDVPRPVLAAVAVVLVAFGCTTTHSTVVGPTAQGGALSAVISATPTSGRAPLDVAFTSTVKGGPEGQAYRYQWTFGDGRASTEANPRIQFTAGGSYDVRLQVDAGDQSFTTDPLNLRLDGDVMVSCAADPAEAQAPASVSFRADARGGNGTLAYRWDFGDGTSSSAASPVHTYTAPGSYRQVLTVTSGGASGLCSNVVTVYGPFALSSCKATVAGGTTVQFHATPTFCILDHCAYAWDFGGAGGGTSLLTARPLFTYAAPGTYTASLSASTDGGAQSAACRVTVTVP